MCDSLEYALIIVNLFIYFNVGWLFNISYINSINNIIINNNNKILLMAIINIQFYYFFL